MELNVTILCKDSLTYGRHRLLHSKTGYSYTTRGLHYNLQYRALASITTTAKQDKEIFRKNKKHTNGSITKLIVFFVEIGCKISTAKFELF